MLIPCLRYRNAPAAIAWLCAAFGFERRLVVPGPDDTVLHAQLALGDGMIMLGSARADDYGDHFRQPDEIGGNTTQMVCVVVPDADVVYTRAKATGAGITTEIHDQPYGGRGFACVDPEGHHWYVGSYDPWATVEGGECA
ncbi:MAG: VOC family protein [Bryobacteraceae bacterium]